MKDGNCREKVWKIYDYIQQNLYLNRPDMEIGDKWFNSALLFSLFTGLNRGKELIIGEPGLGKTTSAEHICALLYQFPMGLIWGSEVSGHPEQTEEKIIGRPDLGRLNQGEEIVVWSNFAQLPIKIVDEINRLPETKQSMILDGVDRGNWEYLNDVIINEEYCLFATANYHDRGTNTIITPLLDRFDVLVESKHPGPNLAFMIGMQNKREHPLRNPEYEQKFQDLLSEKILYMEKMKRVQQVCGRFGDFLERQLGIKNLNREERERIREDFEGLEFDLDANAFLRSLTSELSFCHKYGQKRSDEECEEGCHYTGYLCYQVKNCVSNRLPISVRSYSQTLAWFLGEKNVGIEHTKAVLPYVLAHRLQWKDDYIAQRAQNIRKDPFQIYMAKEAIKDIYRRYNEQSQNIKNALAVAYQIYSGEDLEPVEGDHPIYIEIKKDLELVHKKP